MAVRPRAVAGLELTATYTRRMVLEIAWCAARV